MELGVLGKYAEVASLAGVSATGMANVMGKNKDSLEEDE